MIKWTFCTTNHPEYIDLLALSRAINYNKRRMRSIKNDPMGNGFEDDPFQIQEAINNYAKETEQLSDEYRYMVMMYFNEENERSIR